MMDAFVVFLAVIPVVSSATFPGPFLTSDKYFLYIEYVVHTADVWLAGTDSNIRFDFGYLNKTDKQLLYHYGGMTLWPGNERFERDYYDQMHEIINEGRYGNVEAQCREASKTQEDYLECLTRPNIAFFHIQKNSASWSNFGPSWKLGEVSVVVKVCRFGADGEWIADLTQKVQFIADPNPKAGWTDGNRAIAEYFLKASEQVEHHTFHNGRIQLGASYKMEAISKISFHRKLPELKRKSVGARVSALDSHPWFVRVDGVCGGTIIGRRWILTATHCVGPSMTVNVGMETKSGKGKFSREYRVERSIEHEHYRIYKIRENYEVLFNDIALLKTGENVDFNERVQKISLPFSDNLMRPGTRVRALGAGRNELDYPTTFEPYWYQHIKDEILEFDVPLRSDAMCKYINPYFEPETMLCHKTTGKSVCPGDSGGPLFKRVPKYHGHYDETVYQFGIVSVAAPCNDTSDTYSQFIAYKEMTRSAPLRSG
ncbi:hypothetical protein L596_025537 [Steinernema carpocapsae]|uniref:Peptidase S1 domain-containing protein n=1 Tax=Steinernema carpocapsae TaxID=34508 RepID=A0A4U5M808_STECR|nr:hypothetical protein L596_025537 [Steinernema carpocapsae]